MTPGLRDGLGLAFEAALAFALAAVLFVAFCLLAAGCVTRTTVCLETAHGLGWPDPVVGHRDTMGASVCADIERP